MQAGWLKHRITIQSFTQSQDESGEQVEKWRNHATMWASIEPLRGRAFIEARGEHADVTTKIRLRFRRDITVDMRVLWMDEAQQKHIYELVAPPIHRLEMRRETELMCREVVA